MRLIDGDALEELFRETIGHIAKRPEIDGALEHMVRASAMAVEMIRDAQTVDAVSVVHGRWVMMDGMKPPEWHHHHQCSVCESYAPMRPPYGGREELSPWCPACGARMDGGDVDG